MELEKAQWIANGVIESLGRQCARVEVAGSVRRLRPRVNDIDIVAQVHPDAVPALHELVHTLGVVVVRGKENIKMHLPDGIDCELYLAHDRIRDLAGELPCNWGTLLLCRTGSKDHNIAIARRARELGLHWRPYEGLYRDDVWIAGESEEEMFAALNMGFIAPQYRETP